MDLDTGNIRELPEGEQPKATEAQVDNLPNKNCKVCLGRGYITKILRYHVPCGCVIGSIKKSQQYELEIKSVTLQLQKEFGMTKTDDRANDAFEGAR
jgi:hypothetical protein